jgi:hypothetical protein
MVKFDNAHESIFMHRWDMHIMKQIIWRKKVEECDEIFKYTYFEKQHDQMFPLDVYFSHQH